MYNTVYFVKPRNITWKGKMAGMVGDVEGKSSKLAGWRQMRVSPAAVIPTSLCES